MEFVSLIIPYLTQGGPTAVLVIMFAIIAVLVWDRKALVKELADTTQKVFDSKDHENVSIREILERYHQGNLDLVQALNEIKIVLATMQQTHK